jgi:hypothetical protein
VCYHLVHFYFSNCYSYKISLDLRYCSLSFYADLKESSLSKIVMRQGCPSSCSSPSFIGVSVSSMKKSKTVMMTALMMGSFTNLSCYFSCCVQKNLKLTPHLSLVRSYLRNYNNKLNQLVIILASTRTS